MRTIIYLVMVRSPWVSSPFDTGTLWRKSSTLTLFCRLDTTEFVSLKGCLVFHERTSNGGWRAFMKDPKWLCRHGIPTTASRLQNETSWTRDILSTQQKIVNSISTDYNSKVGEKQFSGVWKGRKSRESKIKIHCGSFAGPTRSSYFAAPSLQVQSASRNSTELRMPRGQRAKLYKACTATRYSFWGGPILETIQ